MSLEVAPNKEYILLSGATSSDTTIEVHSQDELFKFINAIDLSEYSALSWRDLGDLPRIPPVIQDCSKVSR